MFRIAILLFVLVSILSCKKEDISIEDSYMLEKGQTISFDQGDFEIRFARVVNESRCPINTFCAIPGSAEIELLISNEDTASPMNLILAGNPVDTIVNSKYGDYKLQVISLLPYPGYPDNSPYHITFDLEKVD